MNKNRPKKNNTAKHISEHTIKNQQRRIKYLEQYLIPPQYKKGDIVNIFGLEDKKYIVDCIVCYDTCYPIYNLYSADDNEMQTAVEIDIYN